MTSHHPGIEVAPAISIAIFAWNEAQSLRATLQSLLEQSLFTHPRQAQPCCEVMCVANGCTDSTAAVADGVFRELAAQHPRRHALFLRVANILDRGKVNAWNQYVHQLAAPSASVLFMMDADILIHRKETMENMLEALADPQAQVAVDVPCKHIARKPKPGLVDRLSLSTSRMTLAADGQLCGQLYCIRSAVARKIYLPKDLAACEDGLIKTFVCTDFFSRPSNPQRIRVALNAEHTFEAYTTARAILKNQKRQIMGQTSIHVLVDKFLKSCTAEEREDLARFLRAKDLSDPDWLKRLIREHLAATRWSWQLYPGLASTRFRRLAKLSPLKRLGYLPAAIASTAATLFASSMAFRSLKSGCTNYWPKAQRAGFGALTGVVPAAASLSRPIDFPSAGGAK